MEGNIQTFTISVAFSKVLKPAKIDNRHIKEKESSLAIYQSKFLRFVRNFCWDFCNINIINTPIIEVTIHPRMIEIQPSVPAVVASGLGIINIPDASCANG